jgi:signal transduction histidine kinase
MEFILLIAISLIPVIISGSLLYYSKNEITNGLSIFLVLLCFWQIDIAFLYANDFMSEEVIDGAFRLFRIGPIMIMPLMYYFAYLIVKINRELGAFGKIFTKAGLVVVSVFSLIVYVINFTEIGIVSYSVIPETHFSPSHLIPVYGELNSTFIINIVFVFIHTLFILVLTSKLKNAFFKMFFTKLALGAVFVFINGVISGFGIIPLYVSSFNSILVAIILFLGFFQMQSQRLNLANQNLEKQSELMEEVMNINPNYLVVLNKANQIIKINTSMCTLLSINREDVIGQDFSILLKGRNDEKFQTGRLQKITLLDGMVHYIQFGFKFLAYKNEEEYILFYGIDYTNQKENELLQLSSEKSKVIGELAASIAHEIRNPLTTVRGFMQLSKEKNPTGDYEKIVLEEIDRINEVLKELLLLAKPEANASTERDQEELSTDVYQEVMNVSKLFQGASHEQNKEIKIISRLQSTARAAMSKSHFKQVVINILKNSLEALSEKGAIKIILDAVDEQIRVTITDNGKGITKERLTRIGEPYFTNKEKGTGIGLTICFKLIKDYGGEMVVKSKAGWGTSVTLWLPAAENNRKYFTSLKQRN